MRVWPLQGSPNRFSRVWASPFILAAISLIASSAVAAPIGNPIGPATVPPSSISSGLVRSPNPLDASGNLLITGNVGGGKHFRGDVPYNAVSDFGGTLYSTSLDAFLRRSTGSGHYTGRLTPYYSQTGTVTTTRPKPPIGFGESSRAAKSSTGTTGGYALPTQQEAEEKGSRRQAPYEQTPRRTLGVPLRPMSMALQKPEKIIPGGQGAWVPAARRPADKRHEGRLRSAYEFADEQSTEEARGTIDEARQRGQSGQEPFSGILTPQRSERSSIVNRPYRQRQADEHKQLNVYEQVTQQIEDLEKANEQKTEDERQIDRGAGSLKKAPDHFLHDLRLPTRPDQQYHRFTAEPVSQETPALDQPQKDFSLDGLSRADLSARAKAILGKHKTLASFSKDKFSKHVTAAQAYLKQGKYYRAADAYTLASLYKPDDALVYAGKSYALFAAGEYISSALLLSRALETFPEYALSDIDIVAIIGDRDKVDSRIVDIEQWLQASDVGELHFLLSHVYYRLGRFKPAKKAIDAAYKKMPDSPAVAILKKAIDQAAQ